MRAFAPGKLLLTGAYAVLEGAPAIAVAVDRYACADGALVAERASAEVRAAMDAPFPLTEAHALYDGDAKLGLGSSAAILVASLGVRAAERGEDLAERSVRDGLFAAARAAHSKAQSGGSGVDVAVSVYGGVVRYCLAAAAPRIASVALPAALRLEAFWSGTSARTSDLLGRVDGLRTRDAREHAARLRALAEAADHAAAAVDTGDADGFLGAARATGAALSALGAASDAPIVPLPFVELGALAAAEGATFLPSGAGGGDVGAFLGRAPPSETFLARAYLFGMRPLSIGIDRRGVRLDVHDTESDQGPARDGWQ